MRNPKSVTYRTAPEAPCMTATGRDAFALLALWKAGEKGVTPIDNPAPRWSGYIHNLRRAGVLIETVHEKHGGAYPGTHARYVLRTPSLTIENLETGA